MSKPSGSKKVMCTAGHDNFLLPGTQRQCSAVPCRRTVKLVKAVRSAAPAPKRARPKPAKKIAKIAKKSVKKKRGK